MEKKLKGIAIPTVSDASMAALLTSDNPSVEVGTTETEHDVQQEAGETGLGEAVNLGQEKTALIKEPMRLIVTDTDGFVTRFQPLADSDTFAGEFGSSELKDLANEVCVALGYKDDLGPAFQVFVTSCETLVRQFDNNQKLMHDSKDEDLVKLAGEVYVKERKNDGTKRKEKYKEFSTANGRHTMSGSKSLYSAVAQVLVLAFHHSKNDRPQFKAPTEPKIPKIPKDWWRRHWERRRWPTEGILGGAWQKRDGSDAASL